jgi:Trk K+ transport system NAD-binding subunit
MNSTFGQRLRYRFDNLMARGTPALLGLLFVLSLALILIAAAVVSLAGFVSDGMEPLSFTQAACESLIRALDPGTVCGDTGMGFRTVMFLATLGGIFVVSALVGVINNGLAGVLERLRKGRSQVLERGHTLILGWSPQVFTILNELIIANKNQSGACLVVLADKDKVEMEDEIRERVQMRGRTRVVCRSGSPIDPNDIDICSPQSAKSIIVLPSEKDDADTDVIKTVLAITNSPKRRAKPYHIVTQIHEPKNMSVLKMVGKQDNVQALLIGGLIARIVAQTTRQSGQSVVYTELMDFEGDEIYFKHEPALEGKTYGEALLMYEKSSLMGIRRAKTALRPYGASLLNPPMDTRIETGDQIFALAEDDDTVKLSGLVNAPIDEGAIRASQPAAQPKTARCLILGWNEKGTTIVRELDHYVAPGSEVAVVADIPGTAAQLTSVGEKLKNQKFTVTEGDTTDRDLLDQLKLQDYDHIIVLSYADLGIQDADARTLVTLLHLRDIAERDETPFSIVSEMRDMRNRELAKAAKVDDFIVSEQLVSLMISQFSENAELFEVFTDILDPEGAEIYLKPVGDYVVTGGPVNFYTVTEAARRRGETALGYRIAANASNSAQSYGVYTNPPKSEQVTFAKEDKIIVIAEK